MNCNLIFSLAFPYSPVNLETFFFDPLHNITVLFNIYSHLTLPPSHGITQTEVKEVMKGFDKIFAVDSTGKVAITWGNVNTDYD